MLFSSGSFMPVVFHGMHIPSLCPYLWHFYKGKHSLYYLIILVQELVT
jgi:hypothetical protein